MEANYYLAKQIVQEKCPEKNCFYPVLILGIFALLEKYPDRQEFIHDLFLNIILYIKDAPIEELVKDCGIDANNFENDEKKIASGGQTTYGLSTLSSFFYITDDNRMAKSTHPIYLLLSSLCDPEILLNFFIHEMNHIIKSQVNSFRLSHHKDYDTCGIRNGLNFVVYDYHPKTNTVHEANYYAIMDEAINTIQTTEMMNHLLSYQGIYPDPEIQEFLDSCDQEAMKKDISYVLEASLFRQLWKDSTFCQIIENHIVEGDLGPIAEYYDSIMGESEFEILGDYFDGLDAAECSKNRRHRIPEIESYIQEKINEYWKRKEKTYQS